MMHRANRKVENGFFAIDSVACLRLFQVTRGRARCSAFPSSCSFSEGLPEATCTVSSAYPGNEGDIRDIEP